MSVATDASVSRWGARILSPIRREVFEYWSGEELTWDIAKKEATAINKMLWFCRDQVCNAQVDALVDNQAVIHAWNNQGGRSVALNNALKVLFATTAELNVFLCLFYVRSAENPADGPSRRLSSLDYCLTDRMWQNVQQDFGGSSGHTFDLMVLDSNVMKDRFANSLPHLTPSPFPGSSGINLFAQDLTQLGSRMHRPYVFPALTFGRLSFTVPWANGTVVHSCCFRCLPPENTVGPSYNTVQERL